jgi:hypothetical protein
MADGNLFGIDFGFIAHASAMALPVDLHGKFLPVRRQMI